MLHVSRRNGSEKRYCVFHLWEKQASQIYTIKMSENFAANGAIVTNTFYNYREVGKSKSHKSLPNIGMQWSIPNA